MPSRGRPRLPILISQASGDGQPRRHEQAIRAALSRQYAPEFLFARDLEGLLATLDTEIQAGTPLVAVGGGDGTLHHAINHIADAAVTLAPLPLGTGNDFCRSLGLAPGIETALRAVAAGTTRAIDILDVLGRRVVTVAGLGVVSRSALQVNRLARPGRASRSLVRTLGAYAYLGAAGARLLFEPRLARRAVVRWRATPDADWQQVDGRYYGIFLAVRPTLGAGLRLPLQVEPDDGRFEIVLVEKRPRVSVAFCLPRLRSGARVPDNMLSIHHAAETEIDWDGGSSIVGDGEDLGEAVRIRARLLPGALRVVHGVNP
jgi:diacylglycerol kinase (ATP)